MAVSVSCTDKGEQPPLPELSVSGASFDFEAGGGALFRFTLGKEDITDDE